MNPRRALMSLRGVIPLAVLLLLAAPAAMQAQSGSEDGFNYNINTNTITITGYTGPGGAVTIPTEINGLPVTAISGKLPLPVFGSNLVTSLTIPGSVISIGSGAFANCTNLTNVTICYGVTSIGGYTFSETGLTSVTFPSSVTNIGGGAFQSCTNLTNVIIPNSVTSIADNTFRSCSRLTSFTIPGSVTTVGDDAFQSCSSLASITIPGTVTTIGVNAFVQCSSLTNITLSDGITSIEGAAFENCSSLTNITIPSTVTNIGEITFLGCSSLTAITVDSQNSFYSSVNGVLFDKSQTTLIQFPGGIAGSYTVPSGVTGIGEYALSASDLTVITISASVTNIGVDAFASCYSLTAIYFQGNSPFVSPTIFDNPNLGGYDLATVYYLPGTSGWSNIFASLPAVLWNPLIQAAAVQNNQFGFNITGTNNFTVTVEACTNLANPTWTPLQTVTLINGSAYFTDPQWTNYPARYYGLGFP